jgi:hypothetical protein
MRIYFRESEIPEYAGLSRAKRALMRKFSLKEVAKQSPWVAWLPLVLSLVASSIGLAAGESLAGALHHREMRDVRHSLRFILPFAVLGVVAGGALGGFVGEHIVIRRLRRYWRSSPAGAAGEQRSGR